MEDYFGRFSPSGPSRKAACRLWHLRFHVSYSLNSLKGGYIGDYKGTSIGLIKGDTRSLLSIAHVQSACACAHPCFFKLLQAEGGQSNLHDAASIYAASKAIPRCAKSFLRPKLGPFEAVVVSLNTLNLDPCRKA